MSSPPAVTCPNASTSWLADMRKIVGDVSESDVRKAITWALKPKRPRARIVMRYVRVAAHWPQFPV
jgi:hypothetical protein